MSQSIQFFKIIFVLHLVLATKVAKANTLIDFQCSDETQIELFIGERQFSSSPALGWGPHVAKAEVRITGNSKFSGRSGLYEVILNNTNVAFKHLGNDSNLNIINYNDGSFLLDGEMDTATCTPSPSTYNFLVNYFMEDLKASFLTLPRMLRVSIQQELSDQNYYKSGIDGLWGPGTQAAVSNYIKEHKKLNLKNNTASGLGVYKVLLQESVTLGKDLTRTVRVPAKRKTKPVAEQDLDRALALYRSDETALEPIQIWIRGAEQGLYRAQHNVGNMYFYENHTPHIDQDYEKAFYWYSKSINNPNVDKRQFSGPFTNAMNKIAWMLETGTGTEQNVEQAKILYQAVLNFEYTVPTQFEYAKERLLGLGEFDLSEINRKCSGYTTIKGLCWALTQAEKRAILLSRGYEVSAYEKNVYNLNNATIILNSDSVKFTCDNFNACGLSISELARKLQENRVVRGPMEFDRNFNGTYAGVASSEDSLCGRGKKGEKICVIESMMSWTTQSGEFLNGSNISIIFLEGFANNSVTFD